MVEEEGFDMVENQRKLEAAFLAGRADAIAERTGAVPEGAEELFRMVLSESDCITLARLSNVLFHAPSPTSAPRSTTQLAATLPIAIGSGNSNGDHVRGR